MNSTSKHGKAVASPIAIKDELVRLAGLDRETCLAEWRRSFPVANAKHLSIQFLRKALAHEAQIAALGDLNPPAARSLLAIGKGNAPSKVLQTRLKPGSRLLREWNGRTHEIEVVPDGFVWKGSKVPLADCHRARDHRHQLVGTTLLRSEPMKIARISDTSQMATAARRTRCAIYTRKSSEEGLEQEFNSLDAQREACASFIASQKAEGWTLLPEAYDDGGISGGTMERPALQRLLDDIAEGRVDQIVVYKIDRLTRSLADFAKIVDRLDAAGVSFVSVTQSFNTATSMGRLTLNMLLSFAQFEREVTTERIRDKIAASKRKGMWMGGNVPLGYDAAGRTLKINEGEARTVRMLHDLYIRLGTVRDVTCEAHRLGLRTRRRVLKSGAATGGLPFSQGHIYQILSNPIYAGRIRHKQQTHPGQHEAIIEPEIWEALQVRMTTGAARERGRRQGSPTSPLIGMLWDETGDRLSPTYCNKDGVRHRYYVSRRLIARDARPDPAGWRLPAPALEEAIVTLIGRALADPTLLPRLVPDLAAAEGDALRARLLRLGSSLTHFETRPREKHDCLAMDSPPASKLIDSVHLSPGEISIALDPPALANALEIDPERLDTEALRITSPFQLRRRGVEAKLVFADRPNDLDQTLLRNICKARRWYAAIKSGATFSEVALREGISKSHLLLMIDLAFLAPDLVEAVLEGRQPCGLTSAWAKVTILPADWNAQRAMIVAI